MAHQGADPELAVGFLDRIEPGDAVHVDQVSGIGEPELHHRDQALAAGQHFGVVAMGREQIQGLGELVRPVVLETGGQHPAFPFLRRARTRSRAALHVTTDGELAQTRR